MSRYTEAKEINENLNKRENSFKNDIQDTISELEKKKANDE